MTLDRAVSVVAVILAAALAYLYHGATQDVARLELAEQTRISGQLQANAHVLQDKDHREENYREDTTGALAAFKTETQTRIDGMRIELLDAQRLRSNSEERARLYRQQAEAGATAARTLADRLAEMDASLSEGRELVVELQNALGERERLLRLASETLAATRKAAE